LLHSIDIAVVSECLCHLRAQYPIQSPDICIGQQILRIDHPISTECVKLKPADS